MMTVTWKTAKNLLFFSVLSVLSVGMISCAPLLEYKPIDLDRLTPNAADLQALKSVKRIRFLSMESVNPDNPKTKFDLDRKLKDIFKAFPKLELVSHDALQYDATLIIKINGHIFEEEFIKKRQSSSGSWERSGKPFIMYVGDRIEGTVSLDTKYAPVYNWSFDRKMYYPMKNLDPSFFQWGTRLEPIFSRIYGMLGDICGADVLTSALKTKDTSGLLAVKNSFKYLTDRAMAVTPLILVIQDKTLRSEIRSAAIGALGDVGGETAVDVLITAVKEEKSLEAAESLGKIGDIRAVEPLIALMHNYKQHTFGNNLIANALQLITGFPPENRRFFPGDGTPTSDAGSWERWWEKNKIKYVSK